MKASEQSFRLSDSRAFVQILWNIADITRAIVSIKRSTCKLLCVIETVVHRNSNRLKSGMLWQQEQLDLTIEGNMRVL